MASKPYRTNPTGLIRLERKCLTITVSRDSGGHITAFSFERLELSGLALPDDAMVSLVAYSGFEEKRFDLGKVAALTLLHNETLKDLATTNLIFRLFIREPSGHKLLASCESIHPMEDDEDRRPLLPVQYDDLGERLWELQCVEGAPPVLRVNDNPHLDLRAHFESRDPLIRGAIVPQALEQGLVYWMLNPATDDDPGTWQNVWEEYLHTRRIEVPENPTDITEMRVVLKWARETATVFAQGVKFVTAAIEKKNQSCLKS